MKKEERPERSEVARCDYLALTAVLVAGVGFESTNAIRNRNESSNIFHESKVRTW